MSLLNKSGYLRMEGVPTSTDGHVRAFDAGPHGIVGGNGAAVVLMKRLEDALKDRDHIYALIKGSAINNDGVNKAGFTAPSIDGQARVIKTALEVAEVEPESIGYIETHGTATELGDPVEIQALKLAFSTDKRQYCRIGSVKTNIGHLDAAAGAAGLIKAALCIKHGIIPPSLNFKRPNPKIDFENSPFYVNAELSKWKDECMPLRAGVSSFGLGGTNAHVILEEAPPPEFSSLGRSFQLLLLSGKTPGALDRNTRNLALHLEKNPGINLADTAYTLQTGRKAHQYRRMLVGSTREEAVRSLSSPGEENLQTRKVTGEKRSLVFMFSGHGSQYVNMGLDLYNQEPQFREEVDRCFHILESFSDLGFKDVLYPSPGDYREAKKKIGDVRYPGPIILLFEYSLAKLLMKWGLQPDAMLGYSFGEYTAACLAGVFSLEDALKLAVQRNEMMLHMPVGSMMSVSLPEEELKHRLPGDISLAAVNGPAFCIVSGPPGSIKQLKVELKAEGHDCYRFLVSRAGHSHMMVPFKEEFTTYFKGIRMHTPKIPYISGLTGTWITRQQATSPIYWARHMTETIRFQDGIGQVIRELNPVFVQVGSDRALPLYVNLHPLKKEENLALNLVRYQKENHPDVGFL
nr:acyltransferase domain-containing protein [Candidatus Aminicenantes bacterium]NIM82000.1 acyltransferase domain-containing protein [Candidatus Aminicenantes bacterium]NIN21388.1 acyltransferase domain-containing protein [Candidatus Aminicenantes bacterium]NIN45209.1 acyltransferase domain-containing protein [Candidatus Aminicenantes bacterium]NIN88026.1 acyltransferase domain-containing protein [Candidatus Aminicenantes bacterium]